MHTVDNVPILIYKALARPSLEKLPPAVDGNMYTKWDTSTSCASQKRWRRAWKQGILNTAQTITHMESQTQWQHAQLLHKSGLDEVPLLSGEMNISPTQKLPPIDY